MVDRDPAAGEFAERFAPHVEHRVSADERVAQGGRLLDVQPLGLLAVVGVGEVKVARNAQQVARGDARARRPAAPGDIGLEGAEVAPAVEDDRQRFAERQPADPQRDRNRSRVVQQRASE